MQKAAIQILTCLFMCCAFGLSWSKSLNEADMPVSSRSAKILKQTLPLAYTQVLVRLSANPAIMTIPQIKNSLSNLDEYLTSYSYQKTSATEDDAMRLHVVFDEAAIKKLLVESGQTVWVGERPATLILLSVETDFGRTIVSSLQDAPFITLLQESAKARGIQVVFPVMDLEDQTVVVNQQDAQSEGDFTPFVKRYHVKDVLFGKVTADEEGVSRIEWVLTLDDRQSQWVSEDSNVSVAVDQGMDKLLETLGNQYASMPSTKLLSSVSLEIEGINGLRDYVKVVSVVRHLHDVAAVSVKDMNLNSLILQVKVAGGQEALVRALSQSTVLVPLNENVSTKSSAVDLVYQWLDAKAMKSASAQIKHVYVHPLYLPDETQDQVITQPYRASQKVNRISV